MRGGMTCIAAFRTRNAESIAASHPLRWSRALPFQNAQTSFSTLPRMTSALPRGSPLTRNSSGLVGQHSADRTRGITRSRRHNRSWKARFRHKRYIKRRARTQTTENVSDDSAHLHRLVTIRLDSLPHRVASVRTRLRVASAALFARRCHNQWSGTRGAGPF